MKSHIFHNNQHLQTGQQPVVLFIAGSFFPKPTGATHAAYRLACKLREHGVDVKWLVDRVPNGQSVESYDGFSVESMWLNSGGPVRKLLSAFRVAFALRFSGNSPRILHFHGGGHMNLLLSRFLKITTGIPCLMKTTLQGWDTPDGIKKYKWSDFCTSSYMCLDAVVAMTSGIADEIKNAGYNGHLHIIPNGVDLNEYRPPTVEEKRRLRCEFALHETRPVILYSGYLGYVKGIDVLLQVCARLWAGGKDFDLLLVGDYTDMKQIGGSIQAYADKIGGNAAAIRHDCIKYVGFTDRISNYMKAADIFIFPSRQEGFGTVQIEAMACGVPIVANDLPGLTCDIIPTSKEGFRVQNINVDHFVDALVLLLSDPATRQKIGSKGMEHVQRYFSLDSVAKRYLQLYSILGLFGESTPAELPH